jgi:glycosyltransferase involved in cell wall biosynthesis
VELTAFYKGDGFCRETLRKLSVYVRKHGIEVVHSHNPIASHYGAAAARLGGAAAAVTTVHGTATLSMPAWAKALFWTSCLANDRIVSVCCSVKETLLHRLPLPARKHSVIYNGIPTDGLTAVPPPRDDAEIVFGTMARLVPVKDHQSLLTAFAALSRKYPNARLKILGDGELRADLERQAGKLGVSEATVFMGWSADVARFLASIDVFVLSSLSEGLPLTILEAMAAGRPLVATSVGGVPEVVESAQCGWLCPAGSSEALAEAMEASVLAPDRHQRGANGRVRAVQHHSLTAMTDNYERLFNDLLRPNARVTTSLY